jgi:DnaK suppressor protein
MVNPNARPSGIDIVDVRVRLNGMADALERRQDALATTQTSLREEVLDEVDRAQGAAEIRFAAALESSIFEARAQIVHALSRIEVGGYGLCEVCGAGIGASRLEFRPESTRCLRCQSVADSRTLLAHRHDPGI